jgi:hypothetical protein
MITDVISSATFASTEADHAMNPQFRALPLDNAIALGRRCGPRSVRSAIELRHGRRCDQVIVTCAGRVVGRRTARLSPRRSVMTQGWLT